MRGTIAKMLRRAAEEASAGMSKRYTRKLYRKGKRKYKMLKQQGVK